MRRRGGHNILGTYEFHKTEIIPVQRQKIIKLTHRHICECSNGAHSWVPLGEILKPVQNSCIEPPTDRSLSLMVWHVPSPMIVQDYKWLSFEWSFFAGYIPVTPSSTEPSSKHICLGLHAM
jgi:hypothetical protein